MPSDSPPSYESVVSHLQSTLDQFGPDRKPQHLVDTYDTLTPAQIDVLVANYEGPPPVTDEQRAAYHIGVAEHMSAEEAIVTIEAAAKESANACASIEKIFHDLTVKLALLDAEHEITKDPFTPILQGLHKDVRGVIHKSRVSAAKIANYCDAFVNTVVPFCHDEELSVDQRKAIIDDFLRETHAFELTAAGLEEEFKAFGDRFGAFIATFGTWAKEKGVELDADIKKLRDEIKDIESTINDLCLGMGIGGAVMATATVLVVAVLACTPLAPFAWIAGAIGIGLTAGMVITIMLIIKGHREDINRKEAKIRDIEKKKADIGVAREALVKLGNEEYENFKMHTGVLSTVWRCVVADAVNIQGKLEQAKTGAGLPSTKKNPHPMDVPLDKAVGIYKAMEVYLRQYAKGIEIAKIPESSS